MGYLVLKSLVDGVDHAFAASQEGAEWTTACQVQVPASQAVPTEATEPGCDPCKVTFGLWMADEGEALTGALHSLVERDGLWNGGTS